MLTLTWDCGVRALITCNRKRRRPTVFPRATMLDPDAVPFTMKLRMFPVATPSARTDPDSSFILTTAAVSTTVRGSARPVTARSTSVSAQCEWSQHARAQPCRRRIPGPRLNDCGITRRPGLRRRRE